MKHRTGAVSGRTCRERDLIEDVQIDVARIDEAVGRHVARSRTGLRRREAVRDVEAVELDQRDSLSLADEPFDLIDPDARGLEYGIERRLVGCGERGIVEPFVDALEHGEGGVILRRRRAHAARRLERPAQRLV